LIHEENQPRTLWKLGSVKNVIEGSDGHIRGAELTVVTNGKQFTLRRPISRLYPLEVNPQLYSQKTPTYDVDATLADRSQEEVTSAMSQEEAIDTRPVRVATVKAHKRMRERISN